MSNVPPDFDLAPPQPVLPDLVVRDENDEVGIFMLALGTAFNDLKGADYARWQLHRYEKKVDHWPLESRGQYWGMDAQCLRVLFGIARETLSLIEEHRMLLDRDEMKAVIDSLPPQSRAAWDEVVRVALRKDRLPGKNDAASLLLKNIRDKLAFHFDAAEIMRGYRAHFKQANPKTHSDRAYVSVGKSMEQTRFYYADAAHIAAVAELTGVPIADVHRQISKVLLQMNTGIRGLLVMFLSRRTNGAIPPLMEESRITVSSEPLG